MPSQAASAAWLSAARLGGPDGGADAAGAEAATGTAWIRPARYDLSRAIS